MTFLVEPPILPGHCIALHEFNIKLTFYFYLKYLSFILVEPPILFYFFVLLDFRFVSLDHFVFGHAADS
jgi:hypothetical protein